MVDPVIALLVEIKNAGWDVRNYAGLARNFYGEAQQAGALSPALATKITDHEARIDGAWARLLDLVSQPAVPASVAEAVKAARANYTGSYQPMTAGIREAVTTGKPAPVPMEQMMAASNQTLGC